MHAPGVGVGIRNKYHLRTKHFSRGHSPSPRPKDKQQYVFVENIKYLVLFVEIHPLELVHDDVQVRS